MTDKKQIYRDAIIDAKYAGCPYTLASAVETIYAEIVKLSEEELHSFWNCEIKGLPRSNARDIVMLAQAYGFITESRAINFPKSEVKSDHQAYSEGDYS
tara:strand:- start:577 stop:873 length:297 start_codon:yes stop_codon:yes gene_type:complete